MFTGLVEKTVEVFDFKKDISGAVIKIKTEAKDIKKGDSIALNGVCLTVSEIKNDILSFDVMNETLNKSNLKFLKPKDEINFERAMLLTSRFDGSIVTGHIDDTIKVKSIKEDGFSKRVEFFSNTDLIVEKGSVVLNGVSLTVSKAEKDFFEVSLIPTTVKETNLKYLKTGDIVNIEFDLIGKYLQKFIKKQEGFKITKEFLVENGF